MTPERVDEFQEEINDAVTVILGVAHTLSARWHELDDRSRRDLAQMLEKKAHVLRDDLLPVINRMVEATRST